QGPGGRAAVGVHPVAAATLGLVHRSISIRQKLAQGGGLGAGVVHRADADGDLQGRAVACEDFQFFHAEAQAFGNVVCVPFGCVGQEQREFLAAQASEQVVGTDECADGAREVLQDLVAGGMTVPVVQLLEVVDVQHQQ